MVTREGGCLAKLGGHSSLTREDFKDKKEKEELAGEEGGQGGEEEMRKREKPRREL